MLHEKTTWVLCRTVFVFTEHRLCWGKNTICAQRKHYLCFLQDTTCVHRRGRIVDTEPVSGRFPCASWRRPSSSGPAIPYPRWCGNGQQRRGAGFARLPPRVEQRIEHASNCSPELFCLKKTNISYKNKFRVGNAPHSSPRGTPRTLHISTICGH